MSVAGLVVTIGVFPGVGVGVNVAVAVAVGVSVAVLEGVAVAVFVGVSVGLADGVNVGVNVGVKVAVEVGVFVAVFVGAAPIVIKPSVGGGVVVCPLNVKTRFGDIGLVFQCNCDVLPFEPMAVNLNFSSVPAPAR